MTDRRYEQKSKTLAKFKADQKKAAQHELAAEEARAQNLVGSLIRCLFVCLCVWLFVCVVVCLFVWLVG